MIVVGSHRGSPLDLRCKKEISSDSEKPNELSLEHGETQAYPVLQHKTHGRAPRSSTACLRPDQGRADPHTTNKK